MWTEMAETLFCSYYPITEIINIIFLNKLVLNIFLTISKCYVHVF